MKSYIIPPDINEWARLAQVSHYLDSGLLIQPVYGPQEPLKDAGKRPRLTLEARLALSREQVLAWFGNGSPDNVGQIPQRPHVAVDLDDKSPDGRALQAFWLIEPDLANIPHAKSARGVHFHVLCKDIPDGIKPLKTIDLLPGLNAELFCDPAANIVLPPSVHPSGIRYTWEGSGLTPLITWTELQRIFKFKVDDQHCRKSSEWKRQFRGDLRTLDLPAFCAHLGLYGQLLDPDEGKHSVQCPWRIEHTTGAQQWSAEDDESVIFTSEGKTGAFKCLHAHCADRSLKELLAWAEAREPGVVDRFCRQTYQTKAEFRSEGEDRKKVCPYPCVHWRSVLSTRSIVMSVFKQKAFFPEDSILLTYLEHCRAFLRSADSYILGAILPVVGAILARRLFMTLGGRRKYPNYFSMIAGPAGNAKSDAILYANSVAATLLADNAFMADDVSPESLFDEYFEPSGGCPDKLFMFDESNIVLADWTRSPQGKAVAARFLRLHDCGRFKENYRRNKQGAVTGGGGWCLRPQQADVLAGLTGLPASKTWIPGLV
jgi:Bifunctional DNA primase/polymerase, N-terminal